jgi:hypothetical protein
MQIENINMVTSNIFLLDDDKCRAIVTRHERHVCHLVIIAPDNSTSEYFDL